MDAPVATRRGETDTHVRLKRLALLWAQANGYSACAAEVSLPQCRYRADVAAYRPQPKQPGVTAIFECKQALADLRRDNCCADATRERLRSVSRRREVLEKHLRIHYPTLRGGDSLYPEYDSHDFSTNGHHTNTRVLRELTALQNRLESGRKFECLVRYVCANLFFLVVPNELFREEELPFGWGPSSKPMVLSLWSVSQSGMIMQRKTDSGSSSASRPPELGSSIAHWVSRGKKS
jgi:hypothetical protein